MPALPKEEIRLGLDSLKGWELREGRIVKELKFGSFKEAMNFVNKVAELAEASSHHPDIVIKYDTVVLSLISHDVGALTKRDFRLAEKIDSLSG